jgi:peptidyl-prolyl cis-trans isomerase SurA
VVGILSNSFEDYKLKIKEKVVTDSRGEIVKEATFNRLKKQLNYSENTLLINQAISKADSNVYTKKWGYALNDELVDATLFIYDSKKVSGKDFFEYSIERIKSEKIPTGFTPKMLFRSYFKSFQNNLIKSYAENNLEKVNKEFGALMSFYKTDMLKAQMLNDIIYEKSVADTSGQRNFYEAQKSNYLMPERANATIISAESEKRIGQIKEIIAKGIPYKLNREPKDGPLFFNKYLTELTNDHKKRLLSLLVIMKRNPSYVIEVGGHNDAGEGDNAATERIRNVVNFFTQNGLPVARIIETDYGKSKPMDRFDWSKNQRVSFQFFSNSKVDVEKVFNEKEPNSVKIQEGIFKKGENKYLNAINWVVGKQTQTIEGQTFEVSIEKIEPQRTKTLRECRGEVIRDWQKQLENQFNADLERKYPVKYNNEVINQLLENVKKL